VAGMTIEPNGLAVSDVAGIRIKSRRPTLLHAMIAFFSPTGVGWQLRMDSMLRDCV